MEENNPYIWEDNRITLLKRRKEKVYLQKYGDG